MDNKKRQKALSEITDEEIGRMLDAREGGRIAGRGDSPCTQGFYEKEYGLEKKKGGRGMIARPVWFDYVEWDCSDPSFPVMKGLRKDTPSEIIRQFREDQEMYRKAREEGIYL